MARKKAKKSSARKTRDVHPDEELARLDAVLRKGLPPLVVLRGEERWYRDGALRRVVAAATERGDELCRHDARDPEFLIAALLDDLTGGALFATSRCVVVEGADSLVKKGARKYSAPLLDAVSARLKADVTGTIVVVADDLRADHALVKAAAAEGGLSLKLRRLWDSPPPWNPDPRQTELARWVLDRAREHEVRIGPDEAVYLAAATGNDLAALDGRLEQLRGASPEELRRVVAWQSGGTPWELAERLVQGDAARAVQGVEALFHAGFRGKDGSRTLEPAALVNMLATQISARLREAAVGAEAVAAGAAPRDAAALAGVRGGPRATDAFQARLRLRSAGRWRAMLEEAVEVERRARSGATVDAADFVRLALRWRRRG